MIAFLALVASGLSIGLVSPDPASAAPQAFGMSMVPDTGRFMIAGNEPGAPLGTPTSVSGSFDSSTGAMTNVSFASPEMHVVQHVTSPQELDVFIDQQLIPLAPGSGQLDANGDMTLNLSFKLHVKIRASVATGDCWSEPIDVELRSTAPYDADTDLVTLKAEGFNIPNLQTSPQCSSLITNSAGGQFAGTNNRLELTLQGDLGAVLNESTTTMTVNNPGPLVLGTSTTMTATVTPVEATGSIDFYDDETYLGTSPADANGVATLTRTLPSGTHHLTARYTGSSEFAGSTSDPTELVVQAKPDFGAAFPAILVPGAEAQVFPLTITNPDDGLPSNLRVDFSIAQTPTDTAAGGLNVTPSQLSMEYQDGNGDWTPVGLTQTGSTFAAMTASYGTQNGFALAPGETREVLFRMASAVGTPKRTLTTTAVLKQVDATTGSQVGANVAQIVGTTIVPPASRVDVGSITVSTLGTGTGASAVPGDSVTRGNYLALKAVIAPAANVAGQPVNPAPLGVAELLVDGIPTATIQWQDGVAPGGLRIPIVPGSGAATNPSTVVPGGSGGFFREFIDTKALTTGTHTLQLNYFGDTNYKGGLSPVTTFTVAPAWGKVYTCVFNPPAGGVYRGRALVSGTASLPAVVMSGTTASFVDAEIKMGTTVYNAGGGTNLQSPVRNLTAQLPGGSVSKPFSPPATASFATFSNPTATQRELLVTSTGMTGSTTISGQPGDQVDVTLDSLVFLNGIGAPGTCEPLGEPARLATVTVAGTRLTVTPGGVASLGDQVTLTADVRPATGGQVEFFDGDTSLGVVPVTSGKAVLNTGNLPGGQHQLRARHSGGSITVNGINLSVGANYSNTVEKQVQSATTTSASSTSAQFLTGPATLKASVVTNPASARVPTGGQVQFKVDGSPIGSPVPLTDGHAELVTPLPTGGHAVTAAYLGSPAFAASTSPATPVTIGKYVTTLAVTSATGTQAGPYFTFPASATLTSPAGPVAGKTITFKVGPNKACTAVTNAAGVATCTAQVPSVSTRYKKLYTAIFAKDATATASRGTGPLLR
ncbi:Ig-like domain-containing protein [Nocardioides humilatus]|nr:Ig-like domain-containing protein [Nocardioides humilatus]